MRRRHAQDAVLQQEINVQSDTLPGQHTVKHHVSTSMGAELLLIQSLFGAVPLVLNTAKAVEVELSAKSAATQDIISRDSTESGTAAEGEPGQIDPPDFLQPSPPGLCEPPSNQLACGVCSWILP